MKAFAIIGLGPRGLYALETLLIQLNNNKLSITVFEPTDEPGAGPVWNSKQSKDNWVNINERALADLKGRPEILFNSKTIDAFPSYHEWAGYAQKETYPDTYPPRKKIGKYLNERYQTLEKVLNKSSFFKRINTQIVSIDFENNQISLSSADNKTYKYDDILITIGHQSTQLPEQLSTWKDHANKKTKTLKVYEDAYPVSQFNNLKNRENCTIGIRGFGLAMIDIMRTLTIGDYGTFKITDSNTFKTKYIASREQGLTLIPFSLDGKPLAPKPLNESIDNWYKPSSSELKIFESNIKQVAENNKKAEDISFLTESISKIASRVYLDLKNRALSHTLDAQEIEQVALEWFKDEDYKHKLLQSTQISTYKLIEYYINMALGKEVISLDFCIGQVWRHCQPTLYASFSHAKADNSIIEKVIKLDDRIKRYSYGPPIESMQQMLALVDAKVLSLDFVNNPKIEAIENGWILTNSDGNQITSEVMINSVLDAPKLLKVDTPIIKSLLNNNLIKPSHSKLGIDTKPNGAVISSNKNIDSQICVLGRLSKGSVIGVDAILECFGKRIEDWAKSFVERL